MNSPTARKRAFSGGDNRGFALIVVLAMMVLLLILSVGLLSLSAIELRSSGQGSAVARAKANARLALQLAVGQLQLNAGPDTRITATSDILAPNATNAPNRMTGVWKSRKLDPENPAALYANKETEFLTWLVSNEDPSLLKSQDFGDTNDLLTNPVTLFSQKILGEGATEIKAGRVPVRDHPSSSDPSGHYAYNVQDEGVKARIDLGAPLAGATDLASQTQILGVGQNPGLDRLKLSDGSYLEIPTDPLTSSKLISLNEADIGFSADRGEFNKKLNDLTPYSFGLMTNVVDGGFKKDLNLMAETETLPAEFAGKGIYETLLGFSSPSDPLWSQALGFARMFNDSDKLRIADGVPVLKSYTPPGWTAVDASSAVVKQRPTGPVFMPSIAKVQVVFSLSARDHFKGHPVGSAPMENLTAEQVSDAATGDPTANRKAVWRDEWHSPWAKYFNGRKSVTTGIGPGGKINLGDPPSNYLFHLDMIHTPVVTIHNPYNIALEFDTLKVVFRNVPMQLNFVRDGVPQLKEFMHFHRMNYGATAGGNFDKTYGLTLQKSINPNEAEPIRLLPGETRVFSPEVSGMEGFTYKEGDWIKYFWDVHLADEYLAGLTGNKQGNLTATPGWRGEQYGFEMDGLLAHVGIDSFEHENGSNYDRGKSIALKKNSQIGVRFRPYPDTSLTGASKDRFIIEVSLNGSATPVSAIEFNYGSAAGLLNQLDKTWSPSAIAKGYLESTTWSAFDDLHDHYSLKLPEQTKVKPFALFSAYAKTTHGGETGLSSVDGSYAGKPWMFNNYAGPVSAQNLATEHPSVHPYELNMEVLPESTTEAIQVVNNRANFITGHGADNLKFGTLHDIPLAPIQSAVSLNAANLGSSFYNPTFSAPIGNSYAHPMLDTSAIQTSGGGADHSYLLNAVFFDGFFQSGIQSNTGPYGDGRSISEISEDFLTEVKPLVDQRFIPYLSDRRTIDEVISQILETAGLENPDQSAGYKDVGAYLLLKGAFNVNSTSVDAWKAMLSSMAKSGGGMNDPNSETVSVSLPEQAASKGARFSRFRLPNANDVHSKETYWQGVREITEDELNALAVDIVKQIKARGPFLSLGEFINRQVGAVDESTLKGALQAAIDGTNLNQAATALDAGYDIDEALVSSYGIANPKALVGNSAQGAPGFLTQADLISVLGNAISVRSDTFLIRAYGDAVDSQNKVVARAYCEAVVQRCPEYVNDAEVATVGEPTTAINQKFGRRFQLRSFRWLNSDEV